MPAVGRDRQGDQESEDSLGDANTHTLGDESRGVLVGKRGLRFILRESDEETTRLELHLRKLCLLACTEEERE